MDTREALTRGNNLFVSGSLAAMGSGLVPEIFLETGRMDRSDSISLLLPAGTVSAWACIRKDRFRRSFASSGLPIIPLTT